MTGRSIGPAIGVFVASAMLSGCVPVHNGYLAVKHAIKPPPTLAASEAPKAGATSRQSRRDVEPAPVVVAARSDTPPPASQIFNFHPRGAAAWREPVILDPNDGPLAGYVRMTAKELREFNKGAAGRLAQTENTASIRCGEVAVAARKPGCVAPGAADHPPAGASSEVPKR